MWKTRSDFPSLAAIALLILAVDLSAPTSSVASLRGIPPRPSFELSGVSAEETSPPQSKTDRDRGKVYNAGTRGLTPPVVIYSPSSDTDPSNTAPGNQPKKEKGKVATVLVEFIVDASGKVAHVTVKKASDRYFANEAERVVRAWRFKPATFKDKPVACRLIAEVKFRRLDGGTKH